VGHPTLSIMLNIFINFMVNVRRIEWQEEKLHPWCTK
jgi:hypothetical protein